MRVRHAIVVSAVILLAGCGRPDLHVLRGNHRFSQGEYGQATISYLRALERDHHVPYVRYDLGGVFYALGETDPARESLEGALSGEGQELLFRTRFNLGSIYYDQGRYGEAVTQFVEALKLKPDEIDAKVNLELALKKLSSSRGIAPFAAKDESLAQETRDILNTARRKEELIWQSTHQSDSVSAQQDW